MMRWPRKTSVWDNGSTAPNSFNGGNDPINPLRIARLRRKEITYRAIGIQIAKEDGRKMPYTADAVRRAFAEYRKGMRDEDGEKNS